MKNQKEKFSNLLGKTIVTITGAEKGSTDIFIETSDGCQYALNHENDCCEYVRVEDVIGDINDLIGHPLTLAEEVNNSDDINDDDYNYRDESHTWTFYKLATINGYVTIRWLGESNGYYSERVDFSRIN